MVNRGRNKYLLDDDAHINLIYYSHEEHFETLRIAIIITD